MSEHARATRTPFPRGQGARRAAGAVALAVLALLGPLLAAPGAGADPGRPTTPSASDVRLARAAAAAAAAAEALAEGRRASAEARLQTLDAQLETQVELWNSARSEADTARAALQLAQGEARSARRAADSAQVDVDRLAVASYQVGADLSGGLGEWAAIIDSAFGDDGIQGLADRTTTVGLVTADRRRDLTSSRTLALTALQQEAAAQRASAELAQREQTVAAAAASVRSQQEVQQAEVAELVAIRDAASATLAKARTQASALQHARTEALARAAAEARARAAAEATRRARGRERARQGQVPRDTGTSSRSWPEGSSTTTAAQRLGALAFARAQFGDPYVAGRAGPDAYDCSGLTSAAYRSVGKAMIQYSQAQFASGRKIPVAQLEPGDLVFFATDPSDWGTIHHVGIYAGGGQMVEAPHTGDVVKTMTIWQDELVAYGARP